MCSLLFLLACYNVPYSPLPCVNCDFSRQPWGIWNIKYGNYFMYIHLNMPRRRSWVCVVNTEKPCVFHFALKINRWRRSCFLLVRCSILCCHLTKWIIDCCVCIVGVLRTREIWSSGLYGNNFCYVTWQIICYKWKSSSCIFNGN